MYESQREDIKDYLVSLGYVWTKHPVFPEFYRCNDIAIIVSYKMIKFYLYDVERKKIIKIIGSFSKNLDEMFWTKYAKEILFYSVEDAIESMLELMEKIEYDRK